MASRRRHVPAAQQQQEGESSCVSMVSSEQKLEHTFLLKETKSSWCWRDSSNTNEVSDSSSSSCIADNSSNSSNSSNSKKQCIPSSAVSSNSSTVRYVQMRSSRSSSRKTRASEFTDSSSTRWDPLTRRNSTTRGATTGRSNNCTKQRSSTSTSCCSSFKSEEDPGGGSTYSPAAAFGMLLQSQQLKRWVHYLILLLRCSHSSFTATPAASALTACPRKHFLPFGEFRFTWPALYRVACCSMFLLLGACCVVATTYWCLSLYALVKTLASFDFPASSSGTPPSLQSVSFSAHVVSSSSISSSFSPSYQPRAAATSSAVAAAGSTSVTDFISTAKAKSATRAEKQRERREEEFSHVLQQHAQLPQNVLLPLQQPSPLGQSTQPQQQALYMEQQRQSVESQKSSQARQQSTVEQPLQPNDQNALNHRDVLQYIWLHDSGGSRGRQQPYVVGAASRRQLARTVQVGPPDTYKGFSASSLWEAFKVAPQEYFLALLFLVSLVLFGVFCSWLCEQRSFQKAVLVSP